MKRNYLNRTLSLLLLLLILILPILLISCNSSIARSSNAIPEGWEVVSKEDNITHIRMKEGYDAYHWINAEKQNDFYLVLDFPGNPERASMKPDINGNVNIAVYMGYDQVQRKFMDKPIEPSEQDAYRLIFNDMGMYRSWKELYEFDVETVTTKTNVDYDGTMVGLTEAVIYSIPISEFSNKYDEMSFFIQFERDKIGDYMPEVYPTSKDTHKEITLDYYQMHNMIHFDSAYRKSVPHTFPYILFENYGIVSIALVIIAILLTLLSSMLKWNSAFSLIPCAVGAVFSWLASRYYSSMPSSVHDMFGGFDYMGEELSTFFGIFGFIALAIVLLILRGIIELIRRFIARKKERL